MSTTKKQNSEIDIRELFKTLPHRYPFLLVDRILDIDSMKSITAIKNVTFNEPFFPGHFKDNPIMPGVLIVEAMAQTCCVLAVQFPQVSTLLEQGATSTLVRINKARFLRPVIPGDTLTLKAEIIRFRGAYAQFNTTASVNENLVSSAELSMMVAFVHDDAKDS